MKNKEMAEGPSAANLFSMPITLGQIIGALNAIMNDDDKMYLFGISHHGGSFEIDIPGCRFTFTGWPNGGEPIGKIDIGVRYYLEPCQEYHFVTPVAVRGSLRFGSAQSTDGPTGTQP